MYLARIFKNHFYRILHISTLDIIIFRKLNREAERLDRKKEELERKLEEMGRNRQKK